MRVGRKRGTKSSSKFCFVFFSLPGNYKNGLTFDWASAGKSLTRIGPRKNGRQGMASTS